MPPEPRTPLVPSLCGVVAILCLIGNAATATILGNLLLVALALCLSVVGATVGFVSLLRKRTGLFVLLVLLINIAIVSDAVWLFVAGKVTIGYGP